MNDHKDGPDDTKYTLIEHLTELRGRLLRSAIAVFVTTGAALYFAPQLLDYTVEPMTNVLRDRNRVDTIIVHPNESDGAVLAAKLEEVQQARLRFVRRDLTELRALAGAAVAEKKPIDLVLVSSTATAAKASDELEGVEPAPEIAYVVTGPNDPMLLELQLEGTLLLPPSPSKAALARVVRRAAAAAGKSAQGDKLVVLSPLDPFFAYLKIAIVIGLFLACPFWLYQAWRFVAPGLYANEKIVLLPVVLSGSVLFIAGGAFAYFWVFPLMFHVLINDMMPASLIGTFTIDKYLTLLMTMTIAFGVVFELPLAMALLAMVGVVTPKLLRKIRKYAIVGSFVFAAIITPTTDPLSLFLMAGPLVVFYEVGIILASIVQRRRAERS